MITSPPNILIINSKNSELQRVEEFIHEVFAFYKFPETCFNKVLLCISEAIINAIAHGNNNDDRKKVELSLDCKTHLLSVKITDEGNGFDFNSLLDPTTKENLLKESGRGIHIIKNMAKNFSFNEIGNSLEFQIECV